jgi:hypothetical protein
MSQAPVNTSGAITVDLVSRTVKSIPVMETEMDQLTGAARNSSWATAVASALLSYSAGVFTNAAFQSGTLTPAGATLTTSIAPLCLVASALLFLYAFVEGRKASSLVSSLREKLK